MDNNSASNGPTRVEMKSPPAARRYATQHEPHLLEVGVELRYFTPAQADAVHHRHEEMAEGGLHVPIGQVLVESRVISPPELKLLMAEVEYRRANQLNNVPQPASTLINRRFGNFQLMKVLAENGRSRVFLARDLAMGRLAVLKVLPSSLAGDAQWNERFRREVQNAGRLQHPNIVTAYGAGEVNGCPYLALEYVPGQSLDVRLEREGNVAEKTAWMIAREVAKALAYAAEQHILHRDIKPANILCGEAGSIKICDLGLSKAMNDSSALTSAGMTVGTPFYMSPEQVRADGDIDGRSDIYALGCTVFHMLTGAVPFLGKGVTGVMRAHIEAQRPDPRSLLPEISEASALLVTRMMEVNPADRPCDANALVTEIDAIMPLLRDPEEIVRPAQRVSPSSPAPLAKKREAYKFFPPEKTWTQQFMEWLRTWVD